MAGKQRRPFADERNVTAARKMFASGATDAEVAARFEVDRSSVVSFRSREGIKSRYAQGGHRQDVGQRAGDRKEASQDRQLRLRAIRRAKGWFDTSTLPPKNSKVLRGSAWEALQDSFPVPLESVTGCCWPIGQDAPFTFCNAPIHKGSYCQAHHAKAYAPVEKVGITGVSPSSLDATQSAVQISSGDGEKFASSATLAATNEAVLQDGSLTSTPASGVPA